MTAQKAAYSIKFILWIECDSEELIDVIFPNPQLCDLDFVTHGVVS